MISNHWFQDIVAELNLNPLSATALQLTSATVEADVKRVIEMAGKLQKRAKKSKLTVDDINLALSVLHQEHIYGLSSSSLISVNSEEEIVQEDVKLNLAEYIARPLTASCPQKIEVNLHWLAVEGVQPRIPENPELVYYDASADTSALSREMAYFYTRVTESLLSGDMKSVATVCSLLTDDSGINDLCGYFSRFLFVHIRRNLKNITSLLSLLRAVESLASNPHVNLEPCLHQILPSVLTCVVASRLGSGYSTDNTHNTHNHKFNIRRGSSSSLHDASISSWGGTHYDLRLYAAKVVSVLVQNYSESYPDLLPRVCKTYLEAIDSTEYLHELQEATINTTTNTNANTSTPLPTVMQLNYEGNTNLTPKSVGTVYGGIVGLGMLGERVISSILFSNFHLILETLSIFSQLSSSSPSSSSSCSDPSLPTPLPTPLPTSSTLPSSSSSSSLSSQPEPLLKKQRMTHKHEEDHDFINGIDGGGVESCAVQLSGFTDDIHTRYIVPSYTSASPSITESLPYIQMIQTDYQIKKLSSSSSSSSLSLLEDGKGLCEFALLNILGWYIVKSLSSSYRLRDAILPSTRRKKITGSANNKTSKEHSWLEFIDQRGEQFVPYYVSVSQEVTSPSPLPLPSPPSPHPHPHGSSRSWIIVNYSYDDMKEFSVLWSTSHD